MESAPELTVLLVSDHAAGKDQSWDGLRAALRALARQTFTGPVEFLLVEEEAHARNIPADLPGILPALRIVTGPRDQSFALKNLGAEQAIAPVVVILDADCLPGPEWLEGIAAAWRANPGAAIINGRTHYSAKSMVVRVLSLLSRAYVDRGEAGPTTLVSNNNASWRRSILLRHPFPENLGPFAQRIQSEAVLREGGDILFSPDFPVIHEFDGLPMEADLRKNCGYGTIVSRLSDSRLPWAWLVRFGVLSIPVFWLGKTIDLWRDALRCWRYFDLTPLEVPLALMVAPFLVALEVPGMLAAFGNRSVGPTEWR